MGVSDWISLGGLFVTVAGFALTLYQLRRTQNSAEAARKAVAELRHRVQQVNTITDLTSALNLLDEIKRLQRSAAWAELPERYSSLRKMLVAIRGANPQFVDEDRETLQGIVTHLATFETRVERALASKPGASPNITNLNKLLLEQADKLHELLTRLKQEIGG